MRPGSQRAKPDIPTDYEEVTCSTPKGQKVTCVPITTLALLKLGRVKMAKKCTRKVREHVLVRWGSPAWVCCDESSGSGNISHQHVTTDNFDDVDHHCAGHCAHCIMTQQCHGWGRGLFSSAAATVTLYYVIKTPLISNPQRQHPFDNISRCQVFCKNLKLAALPMCWLCLLQISKIWKNTAVCGPLWSAVAAIHRWMVSTNSSAPTDHCAGSGDGCGLLPLQSFPLWYYCHWPWRHEPNQALTWTFSFY